MPYEDRERHDEILKGPRSRYKDHGVKHPNGAIETDHLDPDIRSLFDEAISVISRKNFDYSGRTDRISNFRKLAQELDLSMTIIWKVYFQKGMDAISNYCRGEELSSEKLRSRLVDAINYLGLLYLISLDGSPRRR